VKSVFHLLAMGALLAGCRHAEVARQPDGSANPHGYFPGRPGTNADVAPIYLVTPRTPAEMASDSEIVQRLLGTWLLDPQSNSDEYQAITFRNDGSFRATIRRHKQISGAWRVDRGVLFLGKPNASTPIDYPGFHSIDSVDDHHLVCGIGISVAGRMRFTR
jgi:hypothetical protein